MAELVHWKERLSHVETQRLAGGLLSLAREAVREALSPQTPPSPSPPPSPESWPFLPPSSLQFAPSVFTLRAKYPESIIWRKYYGAYSNGRQRCWCEIARAIEIKTIFISVIGIAILWINLLSYLGDFGNPQPASAVEPGLLFRRGSSIGSPAQKW